MKKKIVAVTLITTLTLGLVLTGCGGNREGSNEQTTTGGAISGGAMAKPDGTPPGDAPNGEAPNGNPPDGASGGAPGGDNAAPSSYESEKEYTTDSSLSEETVSSTATDENAIHVMNNANVILKNLTINRTSSDSTGGDGASFYGVGAAVLVTDGKADIEGGTIETDAKGGAGIFSYGSGNVTVKNTTINTKQDTSGGIHVAGGGTLTATNVTATTAGESSAAIRSDRGGGTMTVNKGTYTSNGIGSPAVYCTANINVSNATLTANNSEAICIEGLNNLSLKNCKLTGNMPSNSQNDCTWNVILYQSMSGDSEEGNSNFSMEGGTLTAKAGGMFYTTNTESTFTIKNVKITNSASNDFFLKCTGNSNQRGWGTKGSNGADCKFNAINQKMTGDVIWDSISKLDFKMSSGSTLTGAFVKDESNAGDGGSGYANLTIDKTSTWVVTGNSTLNKLTNSGKIVDSKGKTVTIKKGDGTVLVKGSSSITVTVSSYGE